MGRRRHVVGALQGGGHRLGAGRVVGPEDQRGACHFRRRLHFQDHLGDHGQSAERTGDQLREIEPGDILHHSAARLEYLATAADGMETEQMVARRAGLDAPRTGNIAGDRAADRARAGGGTEQGTQIRRFEGELLVPIGQSRRDLVEGSGGGGDDHQLGRLIRLDAGKGQKVEPMGRLGRPTEPSLAAGTGNVEWGLALRGPTDGIEDLIGGFGLQGIAHGEASEPRQLRKPCLVPVHMDPSQFGAAMQGRVDLARVQQAVRIEGAFDPLLLFQVDLGEHRPHQIAASRRRPRAHR